VSSKRIFISPYFDSGLFSFASTTLILSLYNVNARGINVPNVVVGMALFTGGLAQFLAGMWEFATGNTFGATGMSFPPSGLFLSYSSCMAFEQHSLLTVLSGSPLQPS